MDIINTVFCYFWFTLIFCLYKFALSQCRPWGTKKLRPWVINTISFAMGVTFMLLLQFGDINGGLI